MTSSVRRSHTSFNYILFLTFILCAATTSTITPRYLQSAVYDANNDRAIYIGGTTANSNITSDVYALDLSKKFNRSAVNISTLPSLTTAVADSAAVIDGSGRVLVLGGLQNSCTSNLIAQVYGKNASSWAQTTSTGSPPGPRQGAKAANINGKILYFGGKSLPVCSSSQYYYNTLYKLDSSTMNWTVAASSSPPVAEAAMTLSNAGDGEFMLIGGEAVSSTSTASYVGMTQFAQYNVNSSSWSYLSADQSTTTIGSRTGHSAVSNGSHTYVLGGSIGSAVSSPVLFFMSEEQSALSMTSGSTTNSSSPTQSLYGHSAILTKNGIMIVAFGLVGASNSTTYNTEIFLYDTYKNQWIDTYDPQANAQIESPAKSSLSLGSIIAIILVPLLLISLGLVLLLTIRKRRQDLLKRRRAFPVNRLGTFTPDDSEHGLEHNVSSRNMAEKTNRVHLPPWAAMHACQARSTFVPVTEAEAMSTPDPISEKPDRQNKDYDIQDVQFAYPASPHNMTFTAPRLQLRVVNPDAGSSRNSFDVSRAIPELVETSRSGLITSVPLAITNEDDLELLRSKLSNSPMIGNIDDQLAGLGLIIREDNVCEPETGEVRRIRTISRQKSKRMPDSDNTARYDQAIPPRLSIVSDLSSSLDLHSVLAVGRSLSPISHHSFQDYLLDHSYYSPYLDSPRSSHPASPVHRQPSDSTRPLGSSPIQPPSPTKRRLSGNSSTSRTGLLDPWPSLSIRRDYSGA